jgi:hypothetical protein
MSDNPLRDSMVKNILAQNHGEAITVENLKRFFPPDFDLGEDDLEPYKTTEVEFENSPPPNAVSEQSSGADKMGEQDAAGNAMTPDQARECVRVLQEALAQARGRVMTLTGDQRRARDKLANAIASFVSGFGPPMTREQLVAEEIRRGRFQKQEAQRHSQPGPSYIDRAAFYGRDHSATGHVRSNLQYGHRRGAMPASMKGKIDPRYAAAAMPLVESVRKGAVAKLPSER